MVDCLLSCLNWIFVGTHTHIVWLGRQSCSTEEVESMLVGEINRLSTEGEVVYHKLWKCNVRVVLKLYACLCDRPDKGKRLQMLTGRPYSQRFGYTAHLPSCIDKVVCCNSCFQKLMKDSPLVSQDGQLLCNKCFAFDSRHIVYDVPDGLPLGGIVGAGQKKTRMKKLTFESMRAAVHKSFTMALRKQWTRKMVEAKLRVEGVSTGLRDRVWANAMCHHQLEDNGDGGQSYIRDQVRDHPEKFSLPSLPPMWELKGPMKVEMFVDVAMHLLFLGTHKALCKDFLSRWLVGEKKLSSYSMGLNHKLKLVSSLKLMWMDVLPSAGGDEKKMTYGGWLSRNMIAHCRLSMWLHCHLPDCKSKESGVCSPVHGNYDQYSEKDIRAFCEERMIPMEGAPRDNKQMLQWWFEKMRKSPSLSFGHYDEDGILEYIHNHTADTELLQSLELPEEERRRVFFDHVASNKCVPPVVVTKKYGKKVSDKMAKAMVELIRVHQCMVARVMSGASGASVGRHAKMFLALLHKFDKQMRGFGGRKKVAPKEAEKLELVSRMNYMTLLNMEDAIGHFGPLRLLWEGGRMGKCDACAAAGTGWFGILVMPQGGWVVECSSGNSSL